MADWIPELIRLNSKREKGLITDKQFKIAEKALVPPSLVGVPFLETITYEIDNATTGFLNLRSKVGSISSQTSLAILRQSATMETLKTKEKEKERERETADCLDRRNNCPNKSQL